MSIAVSGGTAVLGAPEAAHVAQGRARMAFVDNIRWIVIAMVVLVHACVTYSGLGYWYYYEKTALDAAAKLLFFAYEIFSQAFFMGILFFIAAVLVPGSYDRKGPRRFITDRLVRLGIPTLVFVLVLNPLTMVVMAANGAFPLGSRGLWAAYRSYLATGAFVSGTGPLWFALALLAFSVLYALARAVVDGLRPRVPAGRAAGPVSPRAVHLAAVLLMLVIALGSFFVRLAMPIGTSWLNMQLCFFPQYVVLFVAGLWAGRSGFLRALPSKAGRAWFQLAFALGVPAWFLLIGLGGAASGNFTAFVGGWHWQAAAFAAWEAFFCVSFSLGLITLLRDKGNARTPATGLLADTCFGIYVFHTPVLVSVSLAMRSLALYPPAKALVAAAAAWGVSLVIARLVRRIPVVGKVFA